MLLTGGLVFLAAAYLQSLHLQPWFSWQSEAFAFIALFLFAADAYKNDRFAEKGTLPVPSICSWFFLLIILIVAQWYSGQIPFVGDALVRGLYFFSCVIGICIGYWWVKFQQINLGPAADGPQMRIAVCLLISAILSIVIAIIQSTQASTIFDGWILPPLAIRRPGANLGQPNHLATLILMGWVSLIYLHETKRIGPMAGGMLLALTVIGLAITESRTGIVSALVISVWWWCKRLNVRFSWGTGPALLFWIALLLALWCWPYSISQFHDGGSGAMASIQGIDTSPGTRLTVWPQLLNAVLQKPWLGWGIGEVPKAHNAVLDQYDSSEPFSYAHNIVLDMALAWGVGITVLVVLGLVWWLATRLRAVNSISGWYSVSLLIPIAVHSLLEFPFAYAYFLVPSLIAVGMVEAQYKPSNFFRISLAPICCALSICAALLLWVSYEYLQVEEDFRIARFEALRVGKTQEEYERPKLHVLTQFSAMLEATRAIPRANMPLQEMEVLRSAALRFPWSALQNRYALSLALNANRDEAIRQLKVIRAMHGERAYGAIRNQWLEYANTQYPQLRGLLLP